MFRLGATAFGRSGRAAVIHGPVAACCRAAKGDKDENSHQEIDDCCDETCAHDPVFLDDAGLFRPLRPLTPNTGI